MARFERGLVRISTVTRLPIGYSFRIAQQARDEIASPSLAPMQIEHLIAAVEDHAMQLQLLLADWGQHLAPAIPDLFAATTDPAELTVSALDEDLDLIAQIIGQPVERLHV